MRAFQYLLNYTMRDKRDTILNRQYRYVGPHNVLHLLQQPAQRTCIHHSGDVLNWIKETQQTLQRDGTVTATFIVDTSQQLWIADRHSEHVVCAAGQNVLSAGEITFAIQDHVEVVEISNQSTGYSPEPESWQVVAEVLGRIGLPHPSDFTTSFCFVDVRSAALPTLSRICGLSVLSASLH
ncbi:MAG: hypothetical protein IT324_28885 [Anaerolineae bacterium]|nr:hypothetical protein [Anaerolineae bacterium]